MKKNVASQVVSAVVVSASDGSAVTASVSVTVTGDAGTQGAGSGTLAHEGGGEWSYVPTQAETNFDHIMFKFSATGAIPVGVQVYTTFPQTGDSFARLGAPAGASVSADIAAIEAQTDDIGAAGAGLSAIPWNSAWDAEVQSEVTDALNAYDPPTRTETTSDKDEILTAIGTAADTDIATDIANMQADVDAILVDTAEIGAAGAGLTEAGGTGDHLTALATAAALATVDSNVDAILVDTGTTLDGKLNMIDANVDSILADTGTDGVVLAAGAITAAKFGASAIDAAAVATDAVNEIRNAITGGAYALATEADGMVQANVKEINGTTLTGTGSSGDEWGPTA